MYRIYPTFGGQLCFDDVREAIHAGCGRRIVSASSDNSVVTAATEEIQRLDVDGNLKRGFHCEMPNILPWNKSFDDR